MRAYTFINSYICGIQVGIQAGHANIQLMVDYRSTDSSVIAMSVDHIEDPAIKTVQEWAENHKTFVWLDGGDSNDMSRIRARLTDSKLPFSEFKEPGLGGLRTAISIVLTTEQVQLVNLIREDRLELTNGTLMGKHGAVYVSPELEKELVLIHQIASSRTKSL